MLATAVKIDGKPESYIGTVVGIYVALRKIDKKLGFRVDPLLFREPGVLRHLHFDLHWLETIGGMTGRAAAPDRIIGHHGR